jgi:hypothetical protein
MHNCKEDDTACDNSRNFADFLGLMLQELNFVVLMLHILHKMKRIARMI